MKRNKKSQPHRCAGAGECYPICKLRRRDVCARCGALRQDHMDYGRPDLVCPTTDAGVFTEQQPKAGVR